MRTKVTIPLNALPTWLGFSPPYAAQLFAKLTPREAQVARWMANGVSRRKAAQMLGIAEKTLDIHAANIKRKFSGANLAMLTRIVLAAQFQQNFMEKKRATSQSVLETARTDGQA